MSLHDKAETVAAFVTAAAATVAVCAYLYRVFYKQRRDQLAAWAVWLEMAVHRAGRPDFAARAVPDAFALKPSMRSILQSTELLCARAYDLSTNCEAEPAFRARRSQVLVDLISRQATESTTIKQLDFLARLDTVERWDREWADAEKKQQLIAAGQALGADDAVQLARQIAGLNLELVLKELTWRGAAGGDYARSRAAIQKIPVAPKSDTVFRHVVALGLITEIQSTDSPPASSNADR